jgi:hypothetical protein
MLLATFGALVLAQPGPSLVRVTCPTDCAVKVAGQRGRRITSQRYEFDNVAPGKVRFEVEGFAGMTMAAVSLEVPAASELDVTLKGDRFKVEATKPRAAPAPTAGARPAATTPSVLKVTCQTPCTISIDGKKRSGDLQVGTLHLGSIEPGRRVVSVRFLGASAERTVEIPAASEVMLSAQDSIVRVTSTTPLK